MADPPRTLRHRSDYRALRAAAYPQAGDALDAIMKGFAAAQRGEPIPPETQAWIAACEAVKRRFPKA